MSNARLQASIAAQIESLSRVVNVPAGALGYGVDLDCVTDITPTCDEVDPMSRVAVAQAAIRTLITPRGTLIDAPDYGFDVRKHCNRATTAAELRSVADQAAAAVRKDDRVDDATVTALYDDRERRLTVSVRLTCVDPELGTFALTFAVDESGAALLEAIE